MSGAPRLRVTQGRIPSAAGAAPLGLSALFFGLACLALLGFLGAGCGLRESEVTNPESQRDPLPSSPETLIVAAPIADRTYRPEDATGTATNLKVLRTGESESIAYLRFGLSSIFDTTGLLDGDLDLHVQQGGVLPVRIAAYEVDPAAAEWTESDLRPPGRTLLPTPFFVGKNTLNPLPGDTLLVEGAVTIPSSLLRRWKNDPSSNRGIAIRLASNSEEGRLDILSSESVVLDTANAAMLTPKLILRRGGELDDASEEPTDDAYVFNDPTPVANGAESTLVVDAFPARRPLLRFEFDTPTDDSSLRRGDVIHRARLRAHVIPGGLAAGDSFQVEVWSVETDWSETSEPDSIVRGILHSITMVRADTETLQVECASAVQRWLDGRGNFGLLLRARREGTESFGVEIGSRESASPPSLQVLYTSRLKPRWEGEEGPR